MKVPGKPPYSCHFPGGSRPLALVMPWSCLSRVIADCRRAYPREACGVLGGAWQPGHTGLAHRIAGVARRALVTGVYPLENVSPTPATAYFASPEDLYRVLMQLDARGEEMLAVYHSHPSGPGVLSPQDLRCLYWPHALQLLVTFGRNPRRVRLRAFAIEAPAAGGPAAAVAVGHTFRGIPLPLPLAVRCRYRRARGILETGNQTWPGGNDCG